ncbi:MAG: DUF4388 domain-containing protein [Bryobacterales bacterium]|nr:DUF4388 domain-containing protein [Bryobacterales bacterium]
MPHLTAYTILVLVRDAQVASAIRQSAEFANPALRVLTAETGSEALALVQGEPVSLAVTILPVKTGFEFVAIASERYPQMPHVAASCSQAGELDEIAIRLMDLLEHQEEEIQAERLAMGVVETLILQRVSSGFLRAISLLDTIRLLEGDSCTSTLTLRQPKTNAQAVLFFRSGRLLDAHTNNSGGADALREVLEWSDVHISISSGCREMEPRVNKPVSQLMAEWVTASALAALPAPEPVAELPQYAAEAEPEAKAPTLRELLASQEVEYEAEAEETTEAPLAKPGISMKAEPARNAVAERLQETVEYDLDALRSFHVAETRAAAEPVRKPAPAEPPRPKLSGAELMEAGFACFRQKDYEGAVRYWEEARRTDPDNKTLTYNLKLAQGKMAGQPRPASFRAAGSGKA